MGVCATVTIEARDRFGNRLDHGGHGLAVEAVSLRADTAPKGFNTLTSTIRELTDSGIARQGVQHPEVTIDDYDTGRYLVTILPKVAPLSPARPQARRSSQSACKNIIFIMIVIILSIECML